MSLVLSMNWLDRQTCRSETISVISFQALGIKSIFRRGVLVLLPAATAAAVRRNRI
ncbi:hypothetical protein NHJ13051_008507 [Beauveria bassiana]